MEFKNESIDAIFEQFSPKGESQVAEQAQEPQVQGELPKEEEPKEEEPKQEEQVVELSEEVSQFYKGFEEKLFQDGLLLPFEDQDGNKIVPQSLDDIAELVKANKEQWIEEAKTQDKEALLQEIYQTQSPAFKFLMDNAQYFESAEDMIPLLQSVQAQDDAASYSLETEEGQEAIIRTSLQLQGFDTQYINDEIQDLKDRDRLEASATKLKPSLDKVLDDRTQLILQEQAKKNYELQVFWNNHYNRLNDGLLNAKEVDGMNISKEHKTLIASSLIPDQQLGGLPLYSMIDNLITQGDITKLAKIALIATDDAAFDNYYGSKKSSQIAKGLQKTLRTNLTSKSSEPDKGQQQGKTKTEEIGHGFFMNKIV